jgi:hypothetical protein
VFGIGVGEIQRIIGAHGETNYCNAVAAFASTFAEKSGRLRDLGLGPEVVGIERSTEGFGVSDIVCDLAMIQVRGEGNETGIGQSRAESFDGVVQPPPGMQDQYTGPFARLREGEKALGLRLRHMGSFRCKKKMSAC